MNAINGVPAKEDRKNIRFQRKKNKNKNKNLIKAMENSKNHKNVSLPRQWRQKLDVF